MSDDKDTQKKLSISGRKTLQLKPSGATTAGSRASGGVVVQRKKKLMLKPGEEPAATPVASAPKTFAPKKKVLSSAPSAGKAASGGRKLTESEMKARAHALELAKAETEKRTKEDADAAKRQAVEEAARAVSNKVQADKDAKTAKKTAVDDAKFQADIEVKKKVESELKAKAEQEEKLAAEKTKAAPAAKKPQPAAKPATENRPSAKPARGRGEPARRTGRLTVTQALSGGAQERQRSFAALKRARAKERRKGGQAPQQKLFREVIIPDMITVAELANRMTEKTVDVIRALMKMDVMATAAQEIDQDTAELIVEEFGHKVKRISAADVEIDLTGPEDNEADLVLRAPVVTVMGHVDHGKTSVLDAFRKSKVVAGEAGGITQHIGAYQVRMSSGEKVTFLDTPGHAAFSAMRSRGASATDIVILVVAADDSIMPQTIEAISHAKAAEVPIIVAINKIDKAGANPDKVRQDLLQHEVFVESMGGEILDVEISALKGTNLDKLEEAIQLQAELLDLKVNKNRNANGVVVEARLDKGQGSVATILVQRGTLKVGDIFVCGNEWGRVRAMLNDHGRNVKKAEPSVPVEILGLNGLPRSGDSFIVVESEAKAREVSEFRKNRERLEKEAAPKATLEAMFEKLNAKQAEIVPLVIKADVQGSSEAIVGALESMSTDEVQAKILHSAVGGISESDVTLASASGAPILGFNVRASRKAADLARQEGVEIRYYSVIYDLVDDIKAVMSGKLAPELRETILGSAEILDIFSAGKTGKAAGCLVLDGVMRKGAKARLLRDDVVIFEGGLGSLRRFKDDVEEVASGTECGMNFASYNDLKKGDVIECYEVEEIERSLD
ncbi:Translation initiation factor 2 [hydrothermal vent metagenome]|uniref:Translation initiation factor 2 n=1 Tax=hydrothermal vent metagenome TaxID=652676 RepID=A0A3B0RAI0_9ZZZZ